MGHDQRADGNQRIAGGGLLGGRKQLVGKLFKITRFCCRLLMQMSQNDLHKFR